MAIAFVQTKTAINNAITLDAAPTPGNLLVAVMTWRAVGAAPSLPTGFTQVGSAVGNAVGCVIMAYRVVQIGDTATFSAVITGGKSAVFVLSEYSGVAALDVTTSATGAGVHPSVSITPTSVPALVVMGSGNGDGNTPGDSAYVAGTGYTLLGEGATGTGPECGSVGRIVTLAGVYTPNMTATAGYPGDGSASNWGAIAATFLAIPAPPKPGVWLDFAGDGFDVASTSSESGLLARRYPEIASSAISDDITSYVKSLTWSRPGDPNHGGTAPGDSCTIIVRNDTGIFTTTNPSSPVYGVLRPGRPVWIGINGDGTLFYNAAQTVHGLFAGRVNKVVPMPQLGFAEAPEAQIIVDGIMTAWRKRRALVEFSSGRTVGEFRAAILASIGVDSDHYDLDDEDQYLLYSGIINTKSTVAAKVKDAFGNLLETARLRPRAPYPDALGLLEELCRSNGTRHAIIPADNKEDWYIYKTFNRDWKLASAVDASWVSSDIVGMTGYEQTYEGVVNFQDAAYTPVVIDGQSRIVWEGPGPFAIHSNAPLALTAEFGDYVFSPTLEYTVVNTGGSGAFTTYLTNYGDGALLSFFHSGSYANIQDVRVRGRRVIRQDTQTYTKTDDASANNTTGYGERSGSTIQSDFLQTPGAAQAIADFIVWKFANPLAKPGLNLRNRTDLASPRSLYDVLGVTFTPIHLSGRRFEIVGLSGTISINTDSRLQIVDTLVALQETPNQAALNFFEIGVSTLGSGALLAP